MAEMDYKSRDKLEDEDEMPDLQTRCDSDLEAEDEDGVDTLHLLHKVPKSNTNNT